MGFTTRLFIADPVRGWRRIPLNLGIFIYIGAETLPAYADHTIVVAFAHIEVDRHLVTQLIRLEHARWRFDSAGTVDQAFLQTETKRRFWPTNRDEAEEKFTFTQAETDCIRKLLNI